MMKYLILLLAVTVLTSEKCKNKKANENKDQQEVVTDNKDGNIPRCLQQRIDSIMKETRWSPPAEVYEYKYKDKTVYLFNSPCCDFFNPLYGSDCQYICAPHGGFTGRGDGLCPDFEKEATKVRLVWKDPR